MLFRQQNAGIRYIKKMNIAIFLPLVISIILTLTACTITKGSIIIRENMQGTGCEMEFNQWSAQNKCNLFLNKDDTLQVEIVSESGGIDLEIFGKYGAEAYTGSGLDTGIFTVTVSEADEYIIQISGKRASGKVILKNLSK
ncbi:MAG: hypothetical protein CVU91_04205 [Firmicutes bacterium HGW-Firmicutes-16]|nr:MAG: hypothetical protein CVU91_04205 [Firmicutes bacterium HGW-Firmicutes-16]